MKDYTLAIQRLNKAITAFHGKKDRLEKELREVKSMIHAYESAVAELNIAQQEEQNQPKETNE